MSANETARNAKAKKKATSPAADSTNDQAIVKPGDDENAVLTGFAQFASQPKVVFRSKMQMAFLALLIFTCSFGIPYGVYKLNFAKGSGASADVYFEIKAINAQGHPLAGARVLLEKTDLGVTDSFGEWRKFMRVKLGSSLVMTILRNSAQGRLMAVKNLVVPLHPAEQGEIQIIKTIQLGVNTESNLITMKPANQLKAKVETTVATTPTTLTSSEVSANASQASQNEFDFSRLNFKVQTGSDASLNLRLQNQVLINLKREAARLGLVNDQNSPWQVSLQHVAVPGEAAGLILVRSNVSDSTSDGREFLQNYMLDGNLLAQRILAQLKRNVAKRYQVMHSDNTWVVLQPDLARGFWQLSPGEKLVDQSGKTYSVAAQNGAVTFKSLGFSGDQTGLCQKSLESNQACYLHSPTLADAGLAMQSLGELVKYKVSVNYTPAATDSLFVGGLKAKPVSAGVWEYWGKPMKMTNLSIVTGDRVRLRTKLFNGPKREAVVSLGAPKIIKG